LIRDTSEVFFCAHRVVCVLRFVQICPLPGSSLCGYRLRPCFLSFVVLSRQSAIMAVDSLGVQDAFFLLFWCLDHFFSGFFEGPPLLPFKYGVLCSIQPASASMLPVLNQKRESSHPIAKFFLRMFGRFDSCCPLEGAGSCHLVSSSSLCNPSFFSLFLSDEGQLSFFTRYSISLTRLFPPTRRQDSPIPLNQLAEKAEDPIRLSFIFSPST